MQLGLGGPDRYARVKGDLAVAISLDIVKYKDRPSAVRQRGDGAFEIDGLGRPRLTCRRIARELVAHNLQPRFAPSSAATVAENDIDRHPVQPGRKGTCSSE